MATFNPFDPRAAFLMGAGANMLQAGGWSPTPVGFGQALGMGLQGGQQSYMQAVQAQRLQQQQKIEEGLQRARQARMEAQQRWLEQQPPEIQLQAQAMGVPEFIQASTRTSAPLSAVAKLQADYEAGRIPEDVYRAGLEKATKATPLVSLSQGYSEEQVKKLAQSDVAYRDELRAEASSARKKVPQLNRAMRLLEKGDFSTGALGPAKLRLGQLASALGFDPENLGLGNIQTGEELDAISNRLVMDSLDAFAGALSERELDFAARANVGLTRTPEVNKALINMAKNAAQRQRKIYREYRKWIRDYGSPDVPNEEGADFESYIDRMIQEEGETVELPAIEQPAPSGGVQAGMGGPVREPVKITPETDLKTLSDDDLIDADISELPTEDKKKWLAEMDRRGL